MDAVFTDTEKNTGMKAAANAEYNETVLFFEISYAIAKATITKSDAKMLGITFSTKVGLRTKENNARR